MSSATPPPARGILIIEDEENIRNLVQMSLRAAGYALWEGGSGEEALGLFREHGRDVGLVLLDVSLPGMDGVQTAWALRAQRPDLPLCFVSGGSLTHLAELQ